MAQLLLHLKKNCHITTTTSIGEYIYVSNIQKFSFKLESIPFGKLQLCKNNESSVKMSIVGNNNADLIFMLPKEFSKK